MKKNRDYTIAAILILIVGFISFVFFSTRISFHDTHEYITVTKELAGIHNVRIHSGHSYVYPFFLSFFVKIFPSIQTIKFINFLWLFLTGLLLYLHSKNKKMLLLWGFSPVVWYMSIQISPILPTAFFFTLGYILFKIYERQKTKKHLVFSALSFGVCLSLYEPALLLVGLFFIIFSYDKKFKESLLFLIFILPTFAIRLALDYYLFDFPLYSWVRYLGNNLLILAGKSFDIPLNYGTYIIIVLLFISPLLLYLYKIDIKKNIKEVIFLGVLFIFFMLRGGTWEAIQYVVMFSSMPIIMLSKILDTKKVIISIILSIIIIIPFTASFFTENKDALALKDLDDLSTQYDYFITDEATPLASLLWTDKPFFIWLREYQSKDIGYFADYNIKTKPKINTLEILELDARLNTVYSQDIDAPLLLDKKNSPPEGFVLERCLRVLCLYNKIK